MTTKIILNYSTEKADEPILSYIIQKTNVPINILHADLTPEGGEIFVEVDATDEKVDEVIRLFEEEGVETKKITHGVRLDEETCIDCGACVSLCPTKALKIIDDYSIVLDEDECVYCRACVPACPVNALSMEKF
ncbi:hypothetical protein AKJ62_00315 [candidate division MSBL1 archaeon SCGC-AAA259D14]|uniref:4Fe-4S ferredoxin-type domain-containing protein n=2 Tax=candidate division MSBL1 TaxID=215777 RepID=A0A133U932_9EURY|nr:hypothetical protein AKJ62_00315 [candidate division MSBL1 archaeon SCGC-AAA259D14]KXA93843.1 hypothetical protein AKJ66_00715 [candidate division MSBL1 archaeon SCGC-AAA259E22]